jgi:hypothetical protein
MSWRRYFRRRPKDKELVEEMRTSLRGSMWTRPNGGLI